MFTDTCFIITFSKTLASLIGRKYLIRKFQFKNKNIIGTSIYLYMFGSNYQTPLKIV